MGSIAQKLKQVTGQDDNSQRIRDQLQTLTIAAKAKISAYREEINQQFLNPESINKQQIPGMRAIRYIEQYHVATKENFSQQVDDHLSAAIDSFFSIGGKDQDTRTDVANGIKALISCGISAIIGATEAGETEEKTYVVVPENNAFVRADIAIWKYNFESSTLITDADTAVAYVLCKSVIDHEKLAIDELIYLVSDTLASRQRTTMVTVHWPIIPAPPADSKLPTFVVGPMRVWADSDGNALVANDKLDKTDPKYWNECTLTDPPMGGVPPSIKDVQVYIDELITLWSQLKEATK